MEILILVLFYYLSQNPDFSESVKPLMSKLKDSEQMLGFLNDLSKFTQTLGAFQTPPSTQKTENNASQKENEKATYHEKGGEKGNKHGGETAAEKQTPRSPTEGIADEFIQNILDSYLKKR
ncbi:MAG: hypothetical protein IKD47_04980 [Clostridia bacterium]|nr:hypothetical protein [Clostridia bacterium]